MQYKEVDEPLVNRARNPRDYRTDQVKGSGAALIPSMQRTHPQYWAERQQRLMEHQRRIHAEEKAMRKRGQSSFAAPCPLRKVRQQR